jgi:SLT domain-containing protein/phage-related protein
MSGARVVRNDVIKLEISTDLKKLIKINSELDAIRNSLTGKTGNDVLDDLQSGAGKAREEVGGLGDEADHTNKKLRNMGQTASNAAFNGLKKVAGVSFKAVIAGITATSAAIGKIGYDAVRAYADFEQLQGGIQTLFKDDWKLMQKYANDAYKTAGMSANAYMGNVTKFSAALLSSVGGDTKQAAELANMAISDIADNANKFGFDVDYIVEAYQSLARGNYEMLDSLSLGYAGTKTGLQKLVSDAAKLDKSIKANDLSYGNIVKSIHAVQVEMDIYGTTAKESQHTITGSFNSMKASWNNLLPSLIQGGDSFDQCVDNLVSTTTTFVNNIKPAITKALSGAGDLITKLTPVIEKEFPVLVEELLPPLIKAAAALLKGLIVSLPSIIKIVIREIPTIARELGQGIADAFGSKSFESPIFNAISKVGLGMAGVLTGGLLAFKGAKAFQSVKSVFSSFGSASHGINKAVSPLSSLAKVNPKIIIKGMANVAVILTGFVVMAAAFAKVAPYIAKMSDGKSLIKTMGTISALGLVGSALTKLAGIVGRIPIVTVLKGLVNIGLVISGMSALFLLVGAVSLLKFDYNNMMQVVKIVGKLGILGGALSAFAGIVGLIPVPVVLQGLANMALVLGGLTGIVVAFGALSKIPKINEFIAGGGDMIANLFGQLGKIAGSLVGGIAEGVTDALPVIGENIASFAAAIKPMFTMFKGVDMGGIGQFFDSFSSFMLKMTGNKFASFFTGDFDLGEMGSKLTTFAKNSSGFFAEVTKLPQAGFTNAKALFDCLAGIKSLPKQGGIAGWFTGKLDFKAIASGLESLAAEGVEKFFGMAGSLNEKAFSNAQALFDCLAAIKSFPKQGGFWSNPKQSVTNKDSKSGLAMIADDLNSFITKTKGFFTDINNLNISKLNALWSSLQSAGKLSTANISKMVDNTANNMIEKATQLPKNMAEGIKSTGKSLSNALVSVWKQAAKDSAKPVNKILSGANWILKEFGSNKKISSWTPYANGTDGHRGGNALVNDGRGAELVQMPNGRLFIPQGRNILIPNAPKGMKVLPAEQTAQLMGRTSPAFRYANGTGDIDIYSYMNNAKGLVDAVYTKYADYGNLKKLPLYIAQSMNKMLKNPMTSMVKKLYEEFRVIYNASAGVEQWRSLVIKALQMEGMLSPGNIALTLMQMQTESGGNPKAINLWDSNAKRGTPSKGLMQVIDPTFKSYARPGFNTNIWDPLSNILAAIRYARARYGSLENAFKGHGYANGGLVTKPGWIGEENQPEMVIPLSKKRRQRGLSLWQQAGSMMGVQSERPGYIGNSIDNSTIAPSFNLTINCTDESSGRNLKRQVTKWVKESIEDTFEMLNEKSPRLQEI